MKQQRDVLVSVLGPSAKQVNKTLSDFKEKVALSTTVSNSLAYTVQTHSRGPWAISLT